MSVVQYASTVALGFALAVAGVASGNAQTVTQKASPAAASSSATSVNAIQQAFTKDECKAIGAVFMKVVQSTKTSDDFRNSMIAWINPATLSCNGPRDIVVRTGVDSDAFNTIRGFLGTSSRPIDIVTRGGLRAIGPTAGLGSK